ncbi:uncharacterized protein M6B38_297825 [Iris pallida]|uniref:PWWP domain-containing protein n=1 Tax=Iris pallida TaxID=29817 RepID=A0AAX6HNJ3_IRIPA|nr:uncharacterized protein M6B38_297825 [Iris pallida]
MASAAETLTKETEEGAEANNRPTSDGAEEFLDATETLAPADGGDPMDVDKEEEKSRVLNASETLVDVGDSAVVAGENLDVEEEKVCVRSAPATLVSVDDGDSAVVAKVNLDHYGEKVAVQNAYETLIPVEEGDSTMVTEESPVGNGEKVPDSEKRVPESVYAVKIDDGDGRVPYYLPHGEDNAGFSATDMVWGKVKRHPWWPGQIFDPKYTSDLASKHQKKDQLLVAYFGDKTFAWCEQSQLKPFVSAFAQMERQTGMDAFTNAVKDAIEEVSRRVELGMSCLCAADEAYTNLKYRVVENAGIREGTCCSVLDKGLIVNSFEPKRLLEFVVALARCPSWGVDTLELATAKAQVKGFYRSKGRAELPVFVISGGLLDNDNYVTPPKSKKSGKSNAEDSAVKKSRGRPKKLKDVSERKLKDVLEEKLTDVLEDVKVISDDSAVLSGKKRPRGRPSKVQNESENGNGGKGVPEDAKEDVKVVSDDSATLSGKKAQVKGFYRSKGRAELPVFVIGGGLLDNDNYVTPPKSKKSGKSNAEDSDVKKSRGRPKKLKDVSERKLKDVLEEKLTDVLEDAKEDVKVVSDDSAMLSGKKRPRGRPSKVQNESENGNGGKGVPEDAKEDVKVVSDDSATLSGKKRPRGRPRKVQNASENGEGGKLKDVPEKKLKDVPEDAKEDVKVVSDDSAVLSGKKRPRGRPRKVQNASENGEGGKLKDVPEDAKEDVEVVNDDSATLSGKKRPRGRPRKVQNASENGKRGASGWKSAPRASAKKHDDDDPNHRGKGRSRKKRVDYLEMVSQPSSARNMSVKVGERIHNVSSQVQGSPPIFKYNSDELQSLESTRMRSVTKKEYASTYEMLSQLCWVAVDPMGMYSFLSMTVSFFTDYRATISTDSSEELMPSKSKEGKRGRKKKTVDSDPELSDVPMADSYWNDLLLQSSPEREPVSRGRKKKTVDSDPELSDVPMADSYWNDLLLQSSPEREPVSRGRKRKKGSKGKKQKKKAKSAAMVDNERGPKVNTSSPSPTDHQELAGVGPSSYVVGRIEEAGEGPNSNAAGKIEGAGEVPRSDAMEKFEQAEGPGSSSVETPTALILSFTEPDALPTEADLMRIFSHFGPLKEAETEILRKTNRAKVVFKSRTDAELAFSSAGKYSVFGSALVSYRLRYLQPLPNGSPGNSAQDKKDTTH